MSADTVFKTLKANSKENCDETVRILLKIIDNIIQNPNNLKIRCLQKNNITIKNKIIQAKGGVDCLKLIGFVENNTSFLLPTSIPIANLHKIKTNLLNLWTIPTTTTSKASPSIRPNEIIEDDKDLPDVNKIKRFVLPPLKSRYTKPFLRRIETYFYTSQAFGDLECQQRAKNLIPLTILEQRAQETLRSLQERIKKDNLPDPELTIQDALLLGLLSWFKTDFFSWVDSPACDSCGNTTSMSHMSTDPTDLQFTNRVEVFKCTVCAQLTKFPRYNDLNLLLETRRGRCGEWAQVFTLMCLALGWDARFVVDETDHVWTEVYSVGRRRWVHCDPCEGACDSPLMYETGWNKQISYVIAYSPEELQDVTWRYTARFKETLTRRRLCTEAELVDAIVTLRNERQQKLSKTRRNYLDRRVVIELLELMTERKATKDEMQGRVSGSEVWRMARGEIRKDNLNVWRFNSCDIIDDKVTVKYSAARDEYVVFKGDGSTKVVKGWESGVLSLINVFRKEEKDWKTVYLSRNESTNKASISWKFEISKNADKVLDKVSLKFSTKTYENGIINVKILSDNINIDFPKDRDEYATNILSGKFSLIICADLSGGKGNVAWQHTQLFRQPIDSNEFPFILSLTFKPINKKL